MPTPGRLYQVELAPNDDELLDWDLPLIEQSETVKKALQSWNAYDAGLRLARSDRYENKFDRPSGTQFGAVVESQNPSIYDLLEHSQGRSLILELQSLLGFPKVVSEKLHSLGIRGTRYLDATGRGSTSASSYNYVIFDDADVNVRAKFSINSQRALEQVEHQLPRIPLRARRLNVASSIPDETLRESALDVFDLWPDAVTDRDGTTITLVHNKQGIFDALFDHLTGEGAGNEFSRQRNQWLPLIPTTIQEARIKLLDSDNRSWMYVAKYDSGDRHMVVVKPDGTLRSQQLLPENANLVSVT